MLRFCLLGTIELRGPDGAALQSVLTQPKRIALLAYLALAKPNGFHRRDTLLGLFWPELNEARGRAALSKTVHHLRRSLGVDVLIGRGAEELALAFEHFASDCGELREAMDAGAWERVLSLYRGPFLDGFFLSDSPEFEHWVASERARLAAAAGQAARKLAERLAARGEIEEAVTLARRAVELAPDDELSFRRLLSALDAVGDRAGAARAFEAFTHRLEAEYAVEASAETQTLMQSIRERETANGNTVHPVLAATADRSGPEDDGSPEAASPTVSTVTTTRRSRRPRASVLAGTALSAMVVLIAILALRAGEHRPLAGERVIVAPFTNLTGDPSLDGVGLVAADWITQGIVRTGFVDVVSSLDAFRSAQVLDTPVADRSAAAPALALARELKVRALVSGSFYRNNGAIAFQAQIIDAENGAVLRVIDGVSGAPSALHPALEKLQQRVLGALGTLLDDRLANWTRGTTPPPDFEAYQLFSEGMAELLLGSALPFESPGRQHIMAAEDKFKAAAARDTTFTLPLIWVVITRSKTSPDVTDALKEVERVKDLLLPVERHMADYVLAKGLPNSAELSFRAARKVVEYTPDSDWQYLYALAANGTSRFRVAVEVLSGLDPYRGWMKEWAHYWGVLGTALHMLGDCKREAEVLDLGATRFPDADVIVAFERSIAHMCAGNMARALAIVDSTLAETNWFAWPLIPELRWHGHAAVADSLAQAMVERMLAPGSTMINSDSRRLSLAYYLIDAGRLDSARVILRELAAKPEWNIPPVYTGLLGIAIRQNDQSEITRLFARLIDLNPRSLPVIRAEHAMMLGNREQALDLLLEAVDTALMIYLHRASGLIPLSAEPRLKQAFERRN